MSPSFCSFLRFGCLSRGEDEVRFFNRGGTTILNGGKTNRSFQNVHGAGDDIKLLSDSISGTKLLLKIGDPLMVISNVVHPLIVNGEQFVLERDIWRS